MRISCYYFGTKVHKKHFSLLMATSKIILVRAYEIYFWWFTLYCYYQIWNQNIEHYLLAMACFIGRARTGPPFLGRSLSSIHAPHLANAVFNKLGLPLRPDFFTLLSLHKLKLVRIDWVVAFMCYFLFCLQPLRLSGLAS